MKTLSRTLIPADFSYYRTGSRAFYEYYKNCTGLLVERIGEGYDFLLGFQAFPGFWSISLEKHDTEITRSFLHSIGVRHALVFWTPLCREEKPAGWWRVPTWYTKRNIHSSRSAFSVLDGPEYYKKWSASARGHRRHVLKHIETGKIRIELESSLEVFMDLYKNTQVQDSEKGFRLRMTEKLFSGSDSSYRMYIAYVDDMPRAGALFIDEGVTSEYFVSFYDQASHPYHLGIAMMDRWFLDSYEKGIKYCDLDHMRDHGQSLTYAGYTKFKESIADFDVFFHDMWVKIF